MAKLQFGPLVSVGPADCNFTIVVWIFSCTSCIRKPLKTGIILWNKKKPAQKQAKSIVGGSEGSWKKHGGGKPGTMLGGKQRQLD